MLRYWPKAGRRNPEIPPSGGHHFRLLMRQLKYIMDIEEGWSVVENKRPQSAEKPKSKGSRGSGGRGSSQKGRKNVFPKSHATTTPTKPKPSPGKDKADKSIPSKSVHLAREDKGIPEKTLETPQKEEKTAELVDLAQSLDALQLTDQPAAPPTTKAWSAGSKLVLKVDESTEIRKVLAPGISAFEDAQKFWKRAQQYLLTPTLADDRILNRQDVVRGLINNNNACFRNVVIQALLSLPPFIRYTTNMIHTQYTKRHILFTLHNSPYTIYLPQYATIHTPYAIHHHTKYYPFLYTSFYVL
ncbi:hypothetical protein EON65_53740 [archaeon]|nr:MAG: hypothetical protein EON65_53740 [archaeon]